MTTYNIYNHLGDIHTTITVNSIEEVEDAIYDLKAYHGFNSVFTYKEA